MSGMRTGAPRHLRNASLDRRQAVFAQALLSGDRGHNAPSRHRTLHEQTAMTTTQPYSAITRLAIPLDEQGLKRLSIQTA